MFNNWLCGRDEAMWWGTGLFYREETKVTADSHSCGSDCLATYVDIKTQSPPPENKKSVDCSHFI